MRLRAQEISVQFSGREILSGITAHAEDGEIITIVGPNGSGKSTLVRAFIGAVPLSAGQITRAPGTRIGYVPQRVSFDLVLPMNVGRFLSLPHAQSPEKIADALGQVGLPGLETRQMAALSGGQLQRVLLARALMERPQLLILDEPTAGLDQAGTADFYQLIAELRDESNCAVIMVSHDLHVVMSASDRVICLNGHVCCEGTPAVVSEAPEYRALFGHGTHGALALYRHEHDHHHHHHHHEDGPHSHG